MMKRDEIAMVGDVKKGEEKLHVLLVGALGCGKSTTIDAIQAYDSTELILWDTPGLGGCTKEHENRKDEILELLLKRKETGKRKIDVVLLILDATTKDHSTAYEALRDVILPNISAEQKIVVALNQADRAIKNEVLWDEQTNCPQSELEAYLEKELQSIAEQIKEETNLYTEPIWYVAGYKTKQQQQTPAHIEELIYGIKK